MKTAIIFMSIIFIIVSGAQSFAQTPVPGGPVSGIWTAAGSPYYILGEIAIAEGQSLVIEPGVRVEFQGHYKFKVQGSLKAVGTYNDTIIFTINDTTGFHDITIPDGGWHGIRFGSGIQGIDSSRINYCIFSFGKATGTLTEDQAGGAIAVHQYPDLIISKSEFYSNAAFGSGGAIALSNANPILEDNYFWQNKAQTGGAIVNSSSSPIIRRSFFVDNHAANSGGAIGLYLNSNCDITANLMTANSATFGGAIQVETNCNPMIRNNLIFGNAADEEGGGVDLENNCQATFINNSIIGNFALFGGGIDVEVNTSPVFRNTILWANTAFVNGPQIHLFSEDSDPDFYYCDIDGGTDSIGTWYGGSTYFTYTGIYENNMDVYPIFSNQGYYLYLLDNGSPCIDEGDPNSIYNDMEDPENPGFALWPSKGTLRNDMGTYGGPFPLNMDILTAIEEPVLPGIAGKPADQFRCFPNPVRGNCNISYRNNITQHISINMVDINGKHLVTLLSEIKDPGEYTLTVNTSPIPPGIYFCTLQAGKLVLTRMLIVEGR
jgi:hypothetical protein